MSCTVCPAEWFMAVSNQRHPGSKVYILLPYLVESKSRLRITLKNIVLAQTLE